MSSLPRVAATEMKISILRALAAAAAGPLSAPLVRRRRQKSRMHLINMRDRRGFKRKDALIEDIGVGGAVVPQKVGTPAIYLF